MVYLEKLQLKAVQKLDVIEERDIIHHQTPSSGGELLQDLGRKRAIIKIEGIFSGESSKKDINSMYNFIRQGKPLSFSSEVIPVSKIIIKKFQLTQERGYENLFRYYIELEEWETEKSSINESSTFVVKASKKAQNISKQVEKKAKKSIAKLMG